mmetsp:Transcript_36024/g.95648  ORF Transcript_36024/g.95648 Transcript_36024/m.95648 type:complete len:507 (-) Transcript_36024:168-1688(-)|eukprot:CAMPEP_0194538982 /NCGR_PEP_ID=MMETSP0253-20130528/78765_1 /TAXON_ID=2966 /ORGANISM="Noctiluca scintillans" /LENGTH=506 /DNA_ID=CAMNT_0039385189 /DNA_START=93 /DNA_END=1613 /DNA_ORIENTATION=-
MEARLENQDFTGMQTDWLAGLNETLVLLQLADVNASVRWLKKEVLVEKSLMLADIYYLHVAYFAWFVVLILLSVLVGCCAVAVAKSYLNDAKEPHRLRRLCSPLVAMLTLLVALSATVGMLALPLNAVRQKKLASSGWEVETVVNPVNVSYNYAGQKNGVLGRVRVSLGVDLDVFNPTLATVHAEQGLVNIFLPSCYHTNDIKTVATLNIAPLVMPPRAHSVTYVDVEAGEAQTVAQFAMRNWCYLYGRRHTVMQLGFGVQVVGGVDLGSYGVWPFKATARCDVPIAVNAYKCEIVPEHARLLGCVKRPSVQTATQETRLSGMVQSVAKGLQLNHQSGHRVCPFQSLQVESPLLNRVKMVSVFLCICWCLFATFAAGALAPRCLPGLVVALVKDIRTGKSPSATSEPAMGVEMQSVQSVRSPPFSHPRSGEVRTEQAWAGQVYAQYARRTDHALAGYAADMHSRRSVADVHARRSHADMLARRSLAEAQSRASVAARHGVHQPVNH